MDISASLDELKLVYRILHENLTENLELMESEFFQELQDVLQAQARGDGIDVTDHRAWDEWLGNEDPVSCEERVSKRFALN